MKTLDQHIEKDSRAGLNIPDQFTVLLPGFPYIGNEFERQNNYVTQKNKKGGRGLP